MQWKGAGQLMLVLLLAACSADPTATVVTDRAAAPSAAVSLPDDGMASVLSAVQPLQRKAPLGRDVRVEATIGRDGGTIRIPQGGFVLTVPPGAVDSDTQFSVTALAGYDVAYEFEPHGATFQVPLDAEQDLRVTRVNLAGGPLMAAYFPDRSMLSASGTGVLVSELIPGRMAPRQSAFQWNIEHFSGYIVAW